MEGPLSLSLSIYIYIYMLNVNVAEIQMGIFPTCQYHLNYRKKFLLLYIVLDIIFNPCNAQDFISVNLYVMYLV